VVNITPLLFVLGYVTPVTYLNICLDKPTPEPLWIFGGRGKSLGPARILASTTTKPYRLLTGSEMKVDSVCV
jgi:hypothetical protein